MVKNRKTKIKYQLCIFLDIDIEKKNFKKKLVKVILLTEMEQNGQLECGGI